MCNAAEPPLLGIGELSEAAGCTCSRRRISAGAVSGGCNKGCRRCSWPRLVRGQSELPCGSLAARDGLFHARSCQHAQGTQVGLTAAPALRIAPGLRHSAIPHTPQCSQPVCPSLLTQPGRVSVSPHEARPFACPSSRSQPVRLPDAAPQRVGNGLVRHHARLEMEGLDGRPTGRGDICRECAKDERHGAWAGRREESRAQRQRRGVHGISEEGRMEPWWPQHDPCVNVPRPQYHSQPATASES